MLDCNVSTDKILFALLNAKDRECLYPSSLIEDLWKDSLIKQNKFYYHRKLQLVSKAPEIDIRTGKVKTYPFYKEIIIKFTLGDLLQYIYDKIETKELLNKDRDLGRLKYLFNKYSFIKDIETLDLLLVMIDLALKDNKKNINNLINIDDYSIEAINLIRLWQKEAKVTHTDKIIWRSNRWIRE